MITAVPLNSGIGVPARTPEPIYTPTYGVPNNGGNFDGGGDDPPSPPIKVAPVGRSYPPVPKPPDIIVNYYGGDDGSGGATGPAAAAPVAEAKSSLNDALAAMYSLFASMGTTAPAGSPDTSGTVQVSQQPTTDTTGSSSGTGKSVIIIAGLVVGLGYLGYHAYKAGWFTKKKGAESKAE